MNFHVQTSLFLLFFQRISAIINGFQANSFDILSQVSIFAKFAQLSDNYTVICGGALIAPNIVLTAAHCVYKSNLFSTMLKITVKDYNIFEKEKDEQVLFSHAIALHPNYGKSDDSNSDVAIIFLPYPIDVCSTFVSPKVVQLPPSNHLILKNQYSNQFTDQQMESASCFTAGWGRTSTGNFSHVPQQMLIQLKIRKQFGKRLVLAKGVVDSTRVCMGDSGSPVYCYFNSKKFMIGVLTEIGTFGQKKNLNIHDQLSLCHDFEYAIVSDWRAISYQISTLLQNFNQFEQLQIGQTLCYP